MDNFSNRGDGVSKKSDNSQVSLGKVHNFFKGGGGSKFSQSYQVYKSAPKMYSEVIQYTHESKYIPKVCRDRGGLKYFTLFQS